MKASLDRYSLLIISKYFKTPDDFINAMLSNKKFENLVGSFHFNPIPINSSSKKLFTNIETQHIYNKYDEVIPNLFNYIVWYWSSIRTIDYYKEKYNIRPVFKQLNTSYEALKSEIKKEGDILIFHDFIDFDDDQEIIDFVDFSNFAKINRCSIPSREVVIGNHINTIPSKCFSGLIFNSIDLSNIIKIDEKAFEKCKYLTSVTLSKHLEIMDINCFDSCSSLKTITISDDSKEFKLDLSYGLYKIMASNGIKCTGNVWITNNEEVPKDVDCKIIKTKELFSQEIVKFDSIQIITSSFFMNEQIENIKQIILSPNVVMIGIKSFYNMGSLESINLEHVNCLKEGCFLRCSKLKEVNISNIKYLGSNAFSGCSNLSSVTYSKYLNYLPFQSFLNCRKLKEIKGIEHIVHIKSICFKGCKELSFDKLPNGIIEIEYANGSKFKIKSIDKDCPILRFGGGCFKGNTTLEYICIPKNNIFRKIIGEEAFSFCTSLKEVKLEGIKNMDGQIFKDCYSLSTIELPSTLKTIGKYCFENCWSLKEIQIPPSVNNIGKGAFLGCKSLTKVEFENGKVKITSDLFKNCPLKEINLMSGNKMKGYFSYEHYLMLKSKGIDVKKVEYTRSDRRKYGNIIPECCCKIGDRSFEGCSMKELTIPSNIKTLGYNCFNKCHNLIKIYMNNELKNSVNVEVENNFDELTINEFPFTALITLKRTYYFHKEVFFKRKLKTETLPIEIIEIKV